MKALIHPYFHIQCPDISALYTWVSAFGFMYLCTLYVFIKEVRMYQSWFKQTNENTCNGSVNIDS